METMEFANTVDQWALTLLPFSEEPTEMPDGSFYYGMRMSGRFSQPFILDR